MQVQAALAVAAQQQHSHGSSGHQASVQSVRAAGNAAQQAAVMAASVRFCQQCGKAHGSQEFLPDPQQPDGVARLCRNCLTCAA